MKDRSSSLRILGGVIVLVGAYTALLPFVGPLFGYPMPPGADVPAWEWNASHFQLHVIPGVAAVIGGALLWLRSRSVARLGAWLAVAAGLWTIVSPFVARAWGGGMGGGMGGGEPSLFMQIITPLGYHYVPGSIVLGLAAFALGLLTARRVAATPTSRGESVSPHEADRFEGQPSSGREAVRA